MTTRSFRLKIALLSGAISGGLLIVAGAWFWQLTYRMELERVDRELRNLGSPQLERVNGGDHWLRFESALNFIGGAAHAPAYILWVRHEDRVLYKSAHWPASFDPESFPELERYEPPFVLDQNRPPPPPRRGEEISPRNPALPRKEPEFYTREAQGRVWRIGVMGNPYIKLIIGADLNEMMTGMNRLRNAYLASMPLVLLLVAAGAWLLAARALRPVKALTQVAEGITARGLEQRIPLLNYDNEMARLISVFNEMLDRLEKSFHQANRFSADAAHELKTPLTILQGELENALQAAPVGSDQQRLYNDMLEEIQRLKSITHKLLLLSLADSGRLQLHLERINMSAIMEAIAEDAAALAQGLNVQTQIEPGVVVAADRDLLGQMVQNLATNAIKYNCPGGFVRFELSREEGFAVLRIVNSGIYIAPEEHERIFHRFYRGSGSDRKIEGVGLGLSLAREIARAHHGNLELEGSTRTETVFKLTIPLFEAEVSLQ